MTVINPATEPASNPHSLRCRIGWHRWRVVMSFWVNYERDMYWRCLRCGSEEPW